MEARPDVKAGVAITSAGLLVAAMSAIVPSATPPDMKVAAAVPRTVHADIALRLTSQDLFNAIFSGYPDTTGPAGAVGVAALLTENNELASTFVNDGFVGLASSFTAGDPLANAFVNGGVVGIAQQLAGDDVVAQAFLEEGFVGVADVLTEGNAVANTFVNEGFVGIAALLTAGDPLANAFVTGGIVGLASAIVPDDTLAQTFIDGGAVAATEEVLLSGTTDEAAREAISSFFSGYPFEDEGDPEDPEDDLPAGPAGVVGLVHNVLDRLAGNPTMPESGEVEEVPAESEALSGEQLSEEELGAATLSGLPEANEPLEPSENGITVSTTGLKIDPADLVDALSPDPVDPSVPDPVDASGTGTSVTSEEEIGSAPAAQPAAGASTPPPSTDSVSPSEEPAAAPAPVASVSEEEDGDDAKELTEEEMKSGNKAEVPPILLQNGAGGGAGGAWGETVKRWQDAANRLGLGGGAPAPSAPDAESGGEAGSAAGDGS
jgi:hypothetical protein